MAAAEQKPAEVTPSTPAPAPAAPAPAPAAAAAPKPAAKPVVKKPQPLPQSPNKLVQLEQEIYERLIRLFDQGQLVEKIDSVPIEMRPKGYDHTCRCCIYRDRALIRARVLACLGFRVEDEDETRTLANYAQEALEKSVQKHQNPVLTVISEACNHCTKQQYLVTDACQNCVAKPCAHNCPKHAISHPANLGRAVIDSDKCIRCGKCVQVCPFHAIIDIPIPCVKACPVGAITPQPDGSKTFDWSKCIQCGGCQRSCPFGSVMQRSMMFDVLRSLKYGKKVVALLAPAVAGDFGSASLDAIVNTVKKLGFHDVLEVSLGADQTAMAEAHEFQERMAAYADHKPKSMPFMTTSCCPAHMACIKKHIPELEDAVSDTPTPMHFTAVMAKEKYPDCLTVFIGPCTAKLAESIGDPFVDFAMSFMETVSLLRARGLELAEPEKPLGLQGKLEGRGFPLCGGVAQAVANFFKPSDKVPLVKPVLIDGLSPAAVKRLRSFAKKPAPGNLIEVMACEGGCVAGPGTTVPQNIASVRAKMCANKSAHHPDAKTCVVKPVIVRGDKLIEPDD